MNDQFGQYTGLVIWLVVLVRVRTGLVWVRQEDDAFSFLPNGWSCSFAASVY